MNTNAFTSDNTEKNSSSENNDYAVHARDILSQPWITLLLGAGLLLGAASRRSLPLALAGSFLVYRSATERWAFSQLLGLNETDARHPATSVPHQTGSKVERSIVISKPPEELYRFWRNLENLPRFMGHIVDVQQLDEKRSHWKVKSVAGTTFEWDAEIINEIPNDLIGWRSLDEADVDHAGSVHFEANPQGGTKVTVIMEYRPPAGNLGAEVARMFGAEPAQVIEEDLRRLKQLLETGGIPAVERQPHGAGL
jgi:uncharacterized membrane protein